MKRSDVLMRLSLALLLPACEPTPLTESVVTGAGDPAAGRAVDDRSQPPALPPGATFMRNPNRRLAGPPAGAGRVAAASANYDAGPVHVAIWSCNNWPQASHPVVQCSVDPDYVLVGGGAWASYNGAGALLTASYPFDPSQLTTWEGRSKDHGIVDAHVLIVYAIGLRLDGVSRSTLLSNMFVNRRSSAVESHPYIFAPRFSPGIFDTSVGCFVDWHGAGNLLTSCDPDNGARSKDHEWADPASITQYRLGISEQIANFGTLQNDLFVNGASDIGTGALEARVSRPSGFVPTGVGGYDNANGVFVTPGRLLTRLAPFTENLNIAAAASKDHLFEDLGSVHVHLFVLRKAP